MNTNECVTALASSSLLNGLGTPVLDKVVAMSEFLDYARDEVVYTEGDRADHLYVLLAGRVRFLAEMSDGEPSITTLSGGSTFGASGIVPSQPRRQASVECVDPAVIAAIDGEMFLALMLSDAALCATIVSRLPERITEQVLMRPSPDQSSTQ